MTLILLAAARAAAVPVEARTPATTPRWSPSFAGTPGLARIQRALEATVWPHLFGGCHLSRDTAGAIQQSGFTITRLEEFLFPAARAPVPFHIAGQPRGLCWERKRVAPAAGVCRPRGAA